jgi:hypothetical protein
VPRRLRSITYSNPRRAGPPRLAPPLLRLDDLERERERERERLDDLERERLL